mgnify:CR=1 FL=1
MVYNIGHKMYLGTNLYNRSLAMKENHLLLCIHQMCDLDKKDSKYFTPL